MGHFAGIITLIVSLTSLVGFAVGWWVSSIERAKQQHKRETEWNHHLNTLRRDRDSFRDQVDIAHGKLRELESHRADGNSPPNSAEIDPASKAMMVRMQGHLDKAKQQINGFAERVQELREQSIEREDLLEQLKKKLTETSRTLHDKEHKLTLSSASNQPEILTNGEGTTQYEKAIRKMRIDMQTRADEAKQDRLRLEHTIGEHVQTISELRKELSQSTNPTGNAGRTRQKLDALRAQFDDLKNESLAQIEQIEQLSQASKVVEHQRTRLKTLQETQQQHEQTIETLEQKTREQETLHDNQLDQMREAMQTQEQIIAQLRDALSKPTAPAKPETALPINHSTTPTTGSYSRDLFEAIEPAARSVQRAPTVTLYEQAPESRDNLKKINGIGPAFERSLNKLGLYTFAQIAALNEGDIEWVAQELRSFPDRILNGHWVEQAQNLLSEDY